MPTREPGSSVGRACPYRVDVPSTTTAPAGRAVVSPWRIFALVGGAQLLLSMNYSLVFVAYGSMAASFDTDAATMSWTLTAYSITSASLMVPAGWAADRFGRKPIVVGGIVVFTLGSVLVSTAPAVGLLIVGRVMQAVGLSLETGAGLATLLDAFPRDRRATAVGAMGAAGGAAATIGPVIGGALVDGLGWRWTFFVNVPIGAALAVVIVRSLPRDQPSGRRDVPDVLGVALLAGGIGALVLAIVKSNAWGVGAPLIALITTAAVLLGLLVRRSLRSASPILQLSLFRDVSYRRGVVLNFLIAGGFSATFFTVIRTFTDGWGMSVAAAGAAAAVIPLMAGPLSVVAGRLSDRWGATSVITPGAIVMAIGLVLYSTQVTAERAVWTTWVPIGCLYGIGVGFAHAACQGAAMRNVPPERLGVGGAMSRIGMDIGAVVNVAISIAVIEHAGDPIVGARRVTAYVACVCVVGALLALRLPRGPRTARV